MSDNNIEFRIWDKEEKRFRHKHEIGEDKTRSLMMLLDGEILECTEKPSHGSMRASFAKYNDRFEVSQYIGRKDSKGVKAFTGDRALFNCGYGDIEGVIALNNAAYEFNASGKHFCYTDDFTIIGNKWEGLHAAEAKAPIEPVCDSTVQQKSLDEAMRQHSEWHKEHVVKPMQEFFLSELSKIRTAPWRLKIDNGLRPDSPFFEGHNKTMQDQIDQQFYFGNKNLPVRDPGSDEWYKQEKKWNEELGKKLNAVKERLDSPEFKMSGTVGSKAEMKFEVHLRLSENEARALDAVVGYGFKSFIKVFYEHLGKAYMGPYEKDCESLFERLRHELSKHFYKFDAARKIFNK